MAYLRLMQKTLQEWAETVASALNIDVTVTDKNLTRIVGTGRFYSKIEESSPEESLFAKVIETKTPNINLIVRDEKICRECPAFDYCNEYANMTYPLEVNDQVIGVVSFASFDIKQGEIMSLKKDEYFRMLKQLAEMIENEISRIIIANKLKTNYIAVDEIINSLNKGIIILNSHKRVIHINIKALEILGMNLSDYKILDKHIYTLIKKIRLEDTGNKDIVGYWDINGRDTRVRYNISKIFLEDRRFSLIISFDEIKEIINIAKTYENKQKIVFDNIIGRSQGLLESIEKSKIAAQTDSTILIRGESGTGKELLAKSIHNESQRRDGPFIVINCAGIPESLMESELFGYERGAFTGANPGGKKGKVELADNGTLFLDEIGDLSLYMQTRLLRVLQERNIERVGGDGKPIDVNIRIIAATHRNLEDLIEKGEFRLDLFYRLNVIPIELPPLKERGEDIFLCSDHIIDKVSKKINTRPKALSKEVKEAFKAYPWPGNLRELENILEHSLCFSTGEDICLSDIPRYFFDNRLGHSPQGQAKIASIEGEDKTLEELRLEFEKAIIEDLIHKYGDSLEAKKLVAQKLNIGLATLYRKIGLYDN
ncbi:MAG: sigma 54-interacting transcriptional regulator [Tissierellaceae bacterium]